MPPLLKVAETIQLLSSLTRTLTDWLDVEVLILDEWTSSGIGIVFCTEPSFQNLASTRWTASIR